MPHVIESPQVFLIGRSTPDRGQVAAWLSHIGVKSFSLPEGATPGESLVMLAGKRCYMSYEVGLNANLTRVREDMREFISNILSVGHGSVIEHAVYNFAVEGVSRVFTAEMNRHRAGMAISEGSLRFVRFDNIGYWVPTSLQSTDDDTALNAKRLRSRLVFERAFTQAEANYRELEEIWGDELSPQSKFAAKKAITSMMRRIVPMGCGTGGVWSGNLRALRHVFNMRCDQAAEEEILLVACKMLDCMLHAEPNFFGDFHKVDGYWRPKYPKV